MGCLKSRDSLCFIRASILVNFHEAKSQALQLTYETTAFLFEEFLIPNFFSAVQVPLGIEDAVLNLYRRIVSPIRMILGLRF